MNTQKPLLGGYVQPTQHFYSYNGYTYPKHFIHLDDEGQIYFPHHVNFFNENLKHIFDKPNICLEIGVHAGASSVWFLETICKHPDSHLYMMDITPLKGYTVLENNLAPYTNWTYIEGPSVDSFKTFNHNGQTKEFCDFIYVDGNHAPQFVLEDAVNSFYCLKPDGILCFDDYLAGSDLPEAFYVKTAVDAFEECFKNEIEFIFESQQKWFIKRKPNEIDKKLL